MSRLPWALFGITSLLVLISLPLSFGREPISDTLLYGLIALTVGLSGALIAARQPRNPIGWIMCAQGVIKAQLEGWGEGFTYHALPTAGLAHWIADWAFVVDGAAYAVVFALFPSGSLLSPRWRWILWLMGPAVAAAIVGRVLSPPLFAIGMVMFLVATGGAIASLSLRFRRSSGVERQQLKYLVLAAALILPAMALSVPLYESSLLVQWLLGLAFLALSVAVGVAILRHRLFDIDLVINRALVYGSLTATLAGLYVGTVLLLQVALNSLTEGSGLAVAASTLAVSALFRPIRARIQGVVDRRFFRNRYDAALTAEAFATSVRDQVDLDAVCADLLEAVRGTVRPTYAVLWLRPDG